MPSASRAATSLGDSVAPEVPVAVCGTKVAVKESPTLSMIEEGNLSGEDTEPEANPNFDLDTSVNLSFGALELAEEGPSVHAPDFEPKPSCGLPSVVQEAELSAPSRLLPLLCAASALEGTDTMLLPAVYCALQGDLGFSLGDLAAMTLVQALCQSLVSPVWGILADRRVLRRKTILIVGCLMQGLITMLLAAVESYPLMVVLRAMNGAMLGALRPTTNGVVAEVTSEKSRGKAYGCLQLSANIGMVVATLAGTPISTRVVVGLQGWRVAFLAVGLVSVFIGLLLALLMAEPHRAHSAKAADGSRGALLDEAKKLLSYFRKPTFCLMVAQGCFGCVPWNALGYTTLFFQVRGLGDVSASVLQACCQCSQAFGALLGGFIGDRMAGRWRLHGRPFTAQASVLAGVPIAWLIFMVDPPTSGTFIWYLGLVVCLGLSATWCASGVNWPILSEIVEPEGRGTIMAWQTALEGSCAAIFGNAAVGLLAQSVFGYDLQNAHDQQDGSDLANVHALGKALVLTSFVPWIICLTFYSLLHWSYPRDLQRLRSMSQEKAYGKQEQEKAQDKQAELPARSKAEVFDPSPIDRPRISNAAAAAVAGHFAI